MRQLNRKFAFALLAGAAIVPGQSYAQGTPSGDSVAAGSTIGEIVVTAQRREERAQDVPIVITAVSAEGLRERSITDLQGMQNQVPSLVVGPNGQASRDVMSPTIRGQGASFQGAPGVVVYMNEVPLPIGFTLSTQGGPGNFVDLQNVQVLSGAQGTLFGRNTTGGAMLLTAARPTDKLEGSISGGFGNYNLTELEAVVNVPLSDTLAVRLVGASRDRDGFTQDITWNKDRDDTHWRMARIGVQWNPTDTISSYTMGYYGYSKTNGTGSVPVSFNIDRLRFYSDLYGYGYGYNQYKFCSNPAAGTPTDCSTYSNLIADQKKRGNRTVAHGIDSFAKNESWSVMNSTDVDLTDGLKLRNIISYAALKTYYGNDQDGTIANMYNTGNTTLSRTAPKDHYHLFTEELQLQGEALDKKLTYTLGGFYSKQSPGGVMRDYASAFCAYPGDAGALTCTAFRELATTNESKALFAQATLDLGALTPALDRVRLTGGYRYTWDQIDGWAVSFSPTVYSGVGADNVTCSFNGASVARTNAYNAITDATRGCRYEGHLKSSAPNWTVGLDYRPVDNVLLYAKVTRGYKAGGFNSYAVNTQYSQFGPEYVTDWEGGFKSDFKVAGRPVRLNVNGFNMDYDKIQRGLPDYNSTTRRSGAVTISTGSARIRGVEVEATFKPADILEIGGNYSYIDAKYKSFKYTSATPVWDCNSSAPTDAEKTLSPDLTCLPMQYMAPNIFSVYGRLSIPTAESFGNVSLFVNYAWTDAQETAPGSLEKFPGTNITWEPGVRLPAYGLLSASLNWKNALGSNLDVSVFGTNLTNKDFIISNTGVYHSSGAQSVMYGEPRMYGLRLKYNFGR